MSVDAVITETLLRLRADRVMAHELLFKHRHPQKTAPFQREMIQAFHSQHPRVVCEAFRDGAKSTYCEETAILGAEFHEFENCLIIGASYDRGCERLESVKHELETNEDLDQIFGPAKSNKVWATDKAVLSNGVVIQAKGVGQSLRGTKYHDKRPDFVIIDDLEDEESVRTPESRAEMMRWLYKVLIPACTPDARIRFVGNRLDPDAVIVKIANDPAWKHLRFPIMSKDMATGEDVPTWPDRFPLEWVYRKRDELQRLGLFDVFNQEYMVEADTPQQRIFRPEHFANIVKVRVRTWEATYAMVDPARSIGRKSATTAIPIWSYIGASRIVVWKCLIGHWLPDEIIEKIIWVNGTYSPVAIGVEEDALNQFILQPLRAAQMKHQVVLPIRKMSAKRYTQGRGKEDFIKGTQPFYAAGEIEWAEPMPDLMAQYLSFPKGAIDGPNAFAYAPMMRGFSVYEDFTQANVIESIPISNMTPLYLALNAHESYVTAQLIQYDGRTLSVLADCIEEGDPGQAAPAVIRRMQVLAEGRPLRAIAPRQHFDQWTNIGLRAALSRVPMDCGQGGEPTEGREEIRALFRAQNRGLPAIRIAHDARWTLNGFAGGYYREVKSNGQLGTEPEENLYKTLMTGLEALCAMMRINIGTNGASAANMRTTADGRIYRSAMVQRR